MTEGTGLVSGLKDSGFFTAISERWPENVPATQIPQPDGFQSSGTDPALASLAHELKTPIAIVSGYIEILLDGKFGSLNQEQRRILTDCAANCLRLKKFVEELLSQAVLRARQVEMHFDVRDFNLCLSEVCSYWKDLFLAKGVALYFQNDPALEPFAFDCDKIHRVVSNLLDNALKFTPSEGSVWLTIEGAQLEGGTGSYGKNASVNVAVPADPRPAVRVTVADTGPGIPAEYHTEIFREFFRISNQKDNPGGTGLGLSIARHLVQAHGGRIWAESEGGAGTRICFLVPVGRKLELVEQSSGGGSP